MQKQLLIAGSVLGALALGHQAVNADTVPATDTSTAQSVQTTTKALPQVKEVVLSATDVTTSDASSTVDDGTTVDNGSVPNDDGTNTDNGGGSASNDDGTNTDNGGGSASNDDGTNTDNGGGSSSNDDGTNTDNGGGSSSNDDGTNTDNGGSSSSDNGGGSSSSDNGSGSSSSSNTDNGNTSSSNNGNTSHVVPVTPDNSGNVVNVPTPVASDADVSNAVKAYNQALADNGKDASNAKVKQAKENLDKAIDKALPKTHAIEKSSMGGSGILALATSGLVVLGGLIYKRKHL